MPKPYLSKVTYWTLFNQYLYYLALYGNCLLQILGIDSWNGDVVWSIYAPLLAPLPGNKLLLYSQRTSAHFPLQPQCVVVGQHKVRLQGKRKQYPDKLLSLHVYTVDRKGLINTDYINLILTYTGISPVYWQLMVKHSL